MKRLLYVEEENNEKKDKKKIIMGRKKRKPIWRWEASRLRLYPIALSKNFRPSTTIDNSSSTRLLGGQGILPASPWTFVVLAPSLSVGSYSGLECCSNRYPAGGWPVECRHHQPHGSFTSNLYLSLLLSLFLMPRLNSPS